MKRIILLSSFVAVLHTYAIANNVVTFSKDNVQEESKKNR